MRTTKPVSTISYNSPAFLKLKLEELVAGGKVSFWAFIEHSPEPDECADEAGKKTHIHLYLEPAKMIQTDELKSFFMEPDPACPDKPKSCIFFRSSKFGDWYLYSIHNKAYLAYKGQKRKYHYKAEQFCVSDPDEMNFLVRSIDMMDITPYMAILEAQSQGLSWNDMVRSSRVPITQIGQYKLAWDALLGEGFDRNGRPGHEKTAEDRPQPSITYTDKFTGEIIDQFLIDLDDPDPDPDLK